MKSVSLRIVAATAFLSVILGVLAFAQDASIDQLLKKLPPPETFAKPPVERVLQQSDPALKDPLGKEIVIALRMRNFSRAVNLSRQLTQRYPRSTVAYWLYGTIALGLRQYGEASSAFHKAIELWSNLGFAHIMLGNVEASQQHFAAALPHFQKATEVEPKNPLGWLFLSACAEKAGHKEQALEYAKKTTTVSPAFLGGCCNWRAPKKRLVILRRRCARLRERRNFPPIAHGCSRLLATATLI
jgi:tetratricopeptide (TPR) repeat protein